MTGPDAAARVLVVDDDAVNRTMLTGLLEREGHEVLSAPDGVRAMEALHAGSVDLVLLDILMPEMDGYQVLAEMKADPLLRHVPVVMISALDDLESAVRCIELGADDSLTKPFNPTLLGARVRAGLMKKRLHDLELEHLAEMNRLNQRLEARVEEQLAELVRTGELRRFLPQQVAQGLLDGQLATGFERRRVTVLFADMVGFTDLSDSLEPEELSAVLNEYLREMTAAAVTHGGTLDNFIGDGIMVLFGAPVPAAEEDQAWSAVQAATAMRDRARELAAELRGRGIPADVQIRVGINTGHCTVGVFGSELLRAYKAVGHAVNIGSRLQTAAAAGSILCGFRTYALVRDRVNAVQREALTVKGSARPVEAWEIVDLAVSGAPA
jgi:class 3 adenylate cyclase